MRFEDALNCVAKEKQLVAQMYAGNFDLNGLEQRIDSLRDESKWDGTIFNNFKEFSEFIRIKDPDRAQYVIDHERNHAEVWEKYGFRVEYGIIETEISFIYFPFVTPIRPQGFNDVEKYRKISLESAQTSRSRGEFDFDKISADIASSPSIK